MDTHAGGNSASGPIRLFESDFLEFFSHIHPAVILAIWLPALAASGILSFIFWPSQVSPFLIAALFAGGIVLWTLTEYILHRFLFHFHARSPRGKRISFLFHGVHHEQPMEKSRLVMPPAVSIPLSAVFFGLFNRFYLLFPVLTGFILGYILYDMAHYSLHHFRLPGGYLLSLRKNHMRHHAATPPDTELTSFGTVKKIHNCVRFLAKDTTEIP